MEISISYQQTMEEWQACLKAWLESKFRSKLSISTRCVQPNQPFAASKDWLWFHVIRTWYAWSTTLDWTKVLVKKVPTNCLDSVIKVGWPIHLGRESLSLRVSRLIILPVGPLPLKQLNCLFVQASYWPWILRISLSKLFLS